MNSLFMNNTSGHMTGQLAQPLIIPPRAGMEIASGGVLMPMINPQSMNHNVNSSNSASSTNPFLAM